MATSASMVLMGYEFLRSTSNSLFKSVYGAEGLPLVMALLPVALIPTLAGYNRLLVRMGAKNTLLSCLVGSGVGIFLCYLGIRAGMGWATGALCLIRDVYVVLLIEQHWSFINSILKQGEAKRFNGLVMTIASVGGIAGGALLHLLAERLGTLSLVLAPALLVVPSLWIVGTCYRRCGHEIGEPMVREHHGSLWKAMQQLFRTNAVLPALFLMVILSQAYSTMIDLGFQGCLLQAYPDIDRQSSVSGLFYSLSNGLSLVLQLLVTPWLLTRFSPTRIHLYIPALHIGLIAWCVFMPGIWSLGTALLVYKGVDYSLFRGAKEVLYVPLSFAVRYQAKECIDILGYRGSKSGFSTLIFLARVVGLGSMSPFLFSCFGVMALGGWFQAAIRLNRSKEGVGETAYGPEGTQLVPQKV